MVETKTKLLSMLEEEATIEVTVGVQLLEQGLLLLLVGLISIKVVERWLVSRLMAVLPCKEKKMVFRLTFFIGASGYGGKTVQIG